MDVDRRSNLQHDRMSECRSFSSNHLPCSQSRKMSIGIVVDSFAKSGSQNPKKNEVAAPLLVPSKGNPVEDRNNRKEVSTPRQVEAPEKENSPWVSTRSFYQKMPTSEAIDKTEQTSNLPATSEVRHRSYGEKDAAATYSVPFSTNGMLKFKSNEHKQKKFKKVTCRMEEKKDVTADSVEKFASATAQEVVPEKEVVEDMSNKADNRGTETLRLKLWEILETVPSENKYCVNNQDLNLGAKPLHPEQKGDVNGNPVLGARQNSDVIESDSERPNHTDRRPMTRSLTRKRAPTKQQPNQMKNSPATCYKKDHLEKNIFSFKDGWFGRLSDAFNACPLTSKRKKSMPSCGVERHEPFYEIHNREENKQAKGRAKKVLPTEKSSSRGNGGGDCMKNSAFTEPKSRNLERDFCQTPPREMKEIPGDIIGSPTFQENADQHEDLSHSSLKNMSQTKYGTHSPIFEMNKPVRSSSSASPPKSKLGELDDHSPAEIVTCRGYQSFKGFLSSKSDYVRSNVQKKSFDDAGDLQDSPSVGSRHDVEEDPETRTSESSSEESDSVSSRDSQSSGDRLHVKGCQHSETLYPDIGTAEKPNYMPPPNKRLCNQKSVKVTDFSSASASPEGVEESNKLQRHLEQNQEDGLASAVALFALALERVKSKVKSVTQEKSAEILMSVAEKVHLQLQNAESQIQADVGKLTSLGKTKRKRLETRFQDLQGQLNVIYERFKEEVNRHLQECSNTLEGLEAYETELKRSMEKQRALHRKLVLQAEETIGDQLSDAEKRIATVHDLARRKMVQLKNVLAECLEEGILC